MTASSTSSPHAAPEMAEAAQRPQAAQAAQTAQTAPQTTQTRLFTLVHGLVGLHFKKLRSIRSPKQEYDEKLSKIKADSRIALQQNAADADRAVDEILGLGIDLERLERSYETGRDEQQKHYEQQIRGAMEAFYDDLVRALGIGPVVECMRRLCPEALRDAPPNSSPADESSDPLKRKAADEPDEASRKRGPGRPPGPQPPPPEPTRASQRLRGVNVAVRRNASAQRKQAAPLLSNARADMRRRRPSTKPAHRTGGEPNEGSTTIVGSLSSNTRAGFQQDQAYVGGCADGKAGAADGTDAQPNKPTRLCDMGDGAGDRAGDRAGDGAGNAIDSGGFGVQQGGLQRGRIQLPSFTQMLAAAAQRWPTSQPPQPPQPPKLAHNHGKPTRCEDPQTRSEDGPESPSSDDQREARRDIDMPDPWLQTLPPYAAAVAAKCSPRPTLDTFKVDREQYACPLSRSGETRLSRADFTGHLTECCAANESAAESHCIGLWQKRPQHDSSEQ